LTQRAQDKATTGDESREAADRLAVEQGEDDGMIVHQDVMPNVHNKKDINAITTR